MDPKSSRGQHVRQLVRDPRSDHKGDMLHCFSLLVGRSRTPALELPFTGQLSKLAETPNEFFLPKRADVLAVKENLVILVARILTEYFTALAPFSELVPKHILHTEMSKKSEVVVLDVLMQKTETCWTSCRVTLESNTLKIGQFFVEATR